MEKLTFIVTPFSMMCIDIIGPITPPSEGSYWLPLMCTRFPEAVPLRDISTATVAEALLEIFSRVCLRYSVFRQGISVHMRRSIKSTDC